LTHLTGEVSLFFDVGELAGLLGLLVWDKTFTDQGRLLLVRRVLFIVKEPRLLFAVSA